MRDEEIENVLKFILTHLFTPPKTWILMGNYMIFQTAYTLTNVQIRFRAPISSNFSFIISLWCKH